jgi:hypothetical protein
MSAKVAAQRRRQAFNQNWGTRSWFFPAILVVVGVTTTTNAAAFAAFAIVVDDVVFVLILTSLCRHRLVAVGGLFLGVLNRTQAVIAGRRHRRRLRRRR